jgi:hypothetical protein
MYEWRIGMKSQAAVVVMMVSGFLIACSPDSDSNSPKELATQTDYVEEIVEEQNNTNPEDNCGSLKPLLKLLPPAKEMGGLPETFRGCDNSSEQTVSVVYSNEGEQYTEYEFKIYVLHPESIYAKTNMTIESANPDQQAYINNTFKLTGDMRKSHLDMCRHYDQNPIIPDGRNPLITQIQNLDVCVMDNMDANKEIWNMFTIKGDLEFRLEFEGYNAGQITTTEIARNHLAPLFDQFGLGQIP